MTNNMERMRSDDMCKTTNQRGCDHVEWRKNADAERRDGDVDEMRHDDIELTRNRDVENGRV